MEHAGRWIALIGRTPADVRDFQVEGPGGILRNTAPHERPLYEPSKRRLTWPNGSWATIYSAEEPDQLRGFSGDTAWTDEIAKYPNPREVWDNLEFGMREVSADRPRICVTTTPRRGITLLKQLAKRASTVVVTGSSYENRANLSPAWFADVIERVEGTELARQEVYGEELDGLEGRVYTSFSDTAYPLGNVDASVVDTGAELYVGQDFNVNPMSTVIAVRVGDECHVLDSLAIRSSNTEEVAEELRRRYPSRRVIVCPDPSGKARRSSAPVGQTDFTILQRAGFEVRAPNAAPLVVDRVNNTNAMLAKKERTRDGQEFVRRRVRIHPRASSLIDALANLTYKEGTSIVDKGVYDHPCDALGYLLWQEFNVLASPPRIAFQALRA